MASQQQYSSKKCCKSLVLSLGMAVVSVLDKKTPSKGYLKRWGSWSSEVKQYWNNRENQTKPNWGTSQSNRWNQVCEGSEGVPWYSKWMQGRGGEKICHKVHTKCHPFFPNKSTLLPRRFKVLKQNASYQISKHHPNLYPKSCPSSFPRQTEIR